MSFNLGEVLPLVYALPLDIYSRQGITFRVTITSSKATRLDAGTRVLVTGAAGFVGSNLAKALVERDVEVHGLVRATSDLRRIADLSSRLHLHTGDVRDPDGLASLMREVLPVAIVHTAIHRPVSGTPGPEL